MSGKDWQNEVLHFWFGELTRDDWFSGASGVDDRIRESFADLPDRLARDLPPETRTDPKAALAAIIALDQFPRNMYRRKPEAFAYDTQAIELARNAVAQEFDHGLNAAERQFLYMPFMHSEILSDQERCVDLFRSLDNQGALDYAVEHRDIIARYGRFPHRNAVLGRASTEEETAFLAGHKGFGQ